ncbi:nucleotidyltransferase family protein [Prosthecobacter sp.]|uniref:nucleotidyltransferase family protein n=1 Tax=Prosthecobacter sp. TaxID=1965333 RepID=UPI002AB88688|nr:nucleotidyltransferase family protein [Prosthecobacter sp.]MDZ4402341.1 nucleotidyltransferase [Prosthecobacter sp.]
MQPPIQSSDGHEFYRAAIGVLRAASLDFLVGGAFALRVYAGIKRDTKDFDLLVRPQDIERMLTAFRSAGFHAELTFPHWLAKVRHGSHFIDLIFRSGNGLCDVDDEWFEYARETDVLGIPLPVCPPEEMLWQKAYIMERERFDGADVQHLLRSCGRLMDWQRLLRRFGPDWQVLFSHLVLFTYVYPGEQKTVPQWVMDGMVAKLRSEAAAEAGHLCRGTLLSRLQYLDDVEQWGYADARTARDVRISAAELRDWTLEARKQAKHAFMEAAAKETPASILNGKA